MSRAKLKARPVARRTSPGARRPVQMGTAALARLMRKGAEGPAVQPLLKVGAATDPAEREADMVAERVLSGPGAALPARGDATAVTPRRSPMDQPSTDALATAPPVPAEQQEIELPKEEDVKTDLLTGDALTEVETGEPAGEEPDPAAQPMRAPMVGPEGGEAPAAVSRVIEAPGPGRPLPAPVRADLEPRFGTRFDDVRLHDGPADRETALAIGARAFAYKSDIWLGPGERAEDRRLMAHELTHVLQQTGRDRSPLTARSGPEAQPRRMIRRFVGDAILEKIEGYARHIPGYTLISYVLGKTPIARKPVQRTVENLIYAVLGLHPLGTMLADKLKETQALQTAHDWVTSQLSTLNLTWSRIEGVVAKAKDLFSILSPLKSITPAFTPLIRDIMTFVGRVKDKVLEFILKGALKLAGPMAEKVWGVLQMAGDTIRLILEDPLKFVANLFRAVIKGFGLFFSNILGHLKKGLLGFIFGSLDGLDIQLPERLDLKGIVSLIFQILRLTWANIRKQLVKRLGAGGERKVALLEKTVDVLRILVTEGVLAIWQKMLALIDNLAQTVVGGVISFITTTLVKAALGWLAGLSNPVGAVIKVALMIYDFIVMLLERLQQIMEFVKSVFGSIAAIARGNIDNAAKAVEDAIGRTVPLILAFLAAIIPVTGIASKIQSILKKLRKPVDSAIAKLVGFLVKKGKKLLAKLIGKVNGKRKLPATSFTIGSKTHKLYAKKKGKGVGIYVQSTESETDAQSKKLAEQYGIFRKEVKGEELAAVTAFIEAFEANTNDMEKEGKQVKPDDQTKSNVQETADLQREANEAGTDLTAKGARVAGLPHVDTRDPAVILRYKTALHPLEGKAGTYGALAKEKKGAADKNATRVLELDHNPGLASLAAVRAWLEGGTQSANTPAVIYFQATTKGRTAAADVAKGVFGALSVNSTERPGATFPALAIYGAYNAKMAEADKTRAGEMTTFLKGKGPEEATAVKVKLAQQQAAKSAEVARAYASEPEALKKNVAAGLEQLRRLGETQLQLAAGAATPPAKTEDVSGLARSLAIDGGSGGGTDFLANEGAAGSYGSLSGKKTLKNYLEADHMPMKAEMDPTANWTLGTFVDRSESDQIKGHEAITGLEDAKDRAQAKAAAGQVMATRLQGANGFTESRGGAVVVASTINQHGTMTRAGDLAADIRGKVAPGYSDATRRAVAEALAAGQPASAASEPARRAINAQIRAALRERIVTRQSQAFDLYASEEAPRIKQANAASGLGDKAVGTLARIASRVRSSAATSDLGGRIDTFFPV